MSVLSEEGARRIAERVRRAEEGTTGELVVALVPTSGDYFLYRSVAAWIVSVVVGIEASVATELEARWVLLGLLPVALGLLWLFGFGPFVRTLVPKRIRDAAVRQRALAAFVELGVSETSERSGVLLLVSEREHRVELLADRGIYERLSQESLDREVALLTEDFRAGRFEDGLGKVIDSLGDALAREFPADASRPNELSNDVRRLPEGS